MILFAINGSVVCGMMEGAIVSTCECFKEMFNAIIKNMDL